MLKFFALCVLFFATGSLKADVEIQNGISIVATRHIDLTSQIVKVKVEYEVKNKGNSDINHFIHTISEAENENLAWISATSDGKKLHISEVVVKNAPKGFVFYKVEFLNLLGAGASINVIVEYSLTSILKPYPVEILQDENQLIRYTGPANVLSAYKVEKETNNFKIGSVKVISFTEHSPSRHTADKIVYGPYENQKPFSIKETTIHYENNSPFVVATHLERIIEVSHWGNIAVEEHIEIEHKGAKLKGPFSRLDFQMDRRGNRQPVVKSFRTHVPRVSSDIYYRDQIGNISTSTIYLRADRLEVELRPRFPLFGGWKTNYVLGYNIPTTDFLFSDGSSNFALKIKLLDHLFDNAVVEKIRVKVILPETTRNIKLVTPYPVRRLADEVHKTYLDIAGRPVIVLEKDNLVNNHIQPLTIYYEFDRIYLLREPLIATLAFFFLFAAIILLFRLDFTIASTNDAKEFTKDSASIATSGSSSTGAHAKKE